MEYTKRNMILVTFIFACMAGLLKADTLPLFFSWDSSYAMRFKPDTVMEKESEYGKYIVIAGFDTTWADAVHTRFAVTNEQNKLNTQILLKEAVVDYQLKQMNLRLSLEDRGYGMNYSPYNSRVADPYFRKFALLEYRWQGIMLDYDFLNYGKPYAGMAYNQLNGIMYNLGYKWNQYPYGADFFVYRTQKDDRYNTPIYQYGALVKYQKDSIYFRQAFVYDSLPLYDNFPVSETDRTLMGWHSMSNLNLYNVLKTDIRLSCDFQRPDSNKDVLNRTIEARLDYKHTRVTVSPGFTDTDINSLKGQTYHLDIAYNLLIGHNSNLRLTGFLDYVVLNGAKPYHKVGIEASYSNEVLNYFIKP